MNDAPDRDVVVFTEALRLPAADRSGYLERACAGDEELRRRVEAVLQRYEKAGDFLADPAAGVPTPNREGSGPGEKPGDLPYNPRPPAVLLSSPARQALRLRFFRSLRGRERAGK